MKKVFFAGLFAMLAMTGFPQKLTKNPEINDIVLTLTPLVFDPAQDTTISFIEFWQDTTSGAKYENKVFACIAEKEKIQYDYGKDWPVVGIGSIGDFRTGDKVSVIIQVHYKDGSSQSFTYQEKLKKLAVWKEFEWALYDPDVYIFYEGEEDFIHSL